MIILISSIILISIIIIIILVKSQYKKIPIKNRTTIHLKPLVKIDDVMRGLMFRKNKLIDNQGALFIFNYKICFFLRINQKKKSTQSSSLVNYIEEKMLLHWNDFRYSTFIVFCIFKAEIYFVYMCFLVNSIFFFLLFFVKIIKAYQILNIHRKSKTQK